MRIGSWALIAVSLISGRLAGLEQRRKTAARSAGQTRSHGIVPAACAAFARTRLQPATALSHELRYFATTSTN